MRKAIHTIHLVWVGLLGLFFGVSALAASSSPTSLSCSTSQNGKAVINEVNSSDNFVEIYLLQSTSISNWALYLDANKMTNLGAGSCTVNGITTADSTTTYPAGTFIYCHDNLGSSKSISNSNNEVLLVDKTGALSSGDATAIDYLSYYVSTNPPNNLVWSVPGACGTTYSGHSASNKDMARVPDGSGSLTDNGNDSTPGSTNTGGASIAKAITSGSTTPTVGSNVTYTITVTASGSASVSNLSVKDVLPSGLTYVSSNSSTGTYVSGTGVWAIGTVVSGTPATLTITATVTTAGPITNTATLFKSTVNAGAASVSLTASVSSASAFDTVEVTKAKATNIYTKLAGTAFTLDILALDASGNLLTTYSNTPTVALVDASSGTCASMTALSGVTITPGTWSNGRNTYTFTSTRAAANVRVRVIDSVTNCSTDNFSIRPASLTLSQSSLSTSPVAAGTTFTLTAAGGTGYSGIPKILTSRTMAADTAGGIQTAINAGMLTLSDTANSALTDSANNSFPAASGGNTSLNLRYHDVGYLSFIAGTTTSSVLRSSVVDTAFTSVDQSGDCISGTGSNTLSGGKYGCEIWSTALSDLGRFKPDHFTVSNTLTGACGSGTSAFTYMDDAHLSFSLSVAAKSSQEITALKYGNACPTSGSCLLTLTPQNGTTALTASRLTPTSALPTGTTLVGTAYQSTTWVNGTYNIGGSSFTYARSTALDGPYDSFNIKVAITDPDSVAISSTSAATSNTTHIRYGRLWIANAFGTSTRSLTIPFEAQYWNGLSFLQNTLDSCTTLATSNIGQGNYHGTLSASNVGALSVGVLNGTSCTSTGSSHAVNAGKGCLLMAAPSSSSIAGSVDLVGDLSTTGSPNLCASSTFSTMTGANLAYLRGAWCSGASDRDPTARATFGVFGSSAKKGVIYLREGY